VKSQTLVSILGQHRMRFALKKYELVHFSRNRKFNLKAKIQLERIEKASTKDIHILRIQVDSKLQWSAYRKKVKEKAMFQVRTLVQTTAST
jgi:hypothetical protein